MTRDELFNIATKKQEEKIKIKEEEQKKLEDTLKSNAKFYWTEHFMPAIIAAAEEGEFSTIFRFAAKNFYINIFYPLLTISNTYNRSNRGSDRAYYKGSYNERQNRYFEYNCYDKYPVDIYEIKKLAEESGLLCNLYLIKTASSLTGKYTYDNAYDLIISWKEEDKEEEVFIPITFSNAKLERNKLTAGLRYDILKRDNFKCQICGRSAEDGVKLHVDHIIPICRGGKTEWNNLRTLCQDCNLGKGSKIEI